MKDQTYKVGERVEKFCPTCQKPLGHTVKSVTKLGRISRVTCSECGQIGAFKSPANAAKIQNLAGKTGAPYDRTQTYRIGQIMQHPTFGVGEVTTVFSTKMIDVLFMDQVRRLIHSRV